MGRRRSFAGYRDHYYLVGGILDCRRWSACRQADVAESGAYGETVQCSDPHFRKCLKTFKPLCSFVPSIAKLSTLNEEATQISYTRVSGGPWNFAYNVVLKCGWDDLPGCYRTEIFLPALTSQEESIACTLLAANIFPGMDLLR